jgi:hypothetical protein
MMFSEMRGDNLFPLFFAENSATAQHSVIVALRNKDRAPVWEVVNDPSMVGSEVG